MKTTEAYEYALGHAPRNPDGSIIEKSLVEMVAANIDIDVEKERLGHARRIVAHKKRPGQTAPEGKVALPGMELYPYEPGRLLADDEGNIIENERARVRFKGAEASRAQNDALKAQIRANREQEEHRQLAEWAELEYAKGRPANEITWDNCVRETGLWKDEDPDVVVDMGDPFSTP